MLPNIPGKLFQNYDQKIIRQQKTKLLKNCGTVDYIISHNLKDDVCKNYDINYYIYLNHIKLVYHHIIIHLIINFIIIILKKIFSNM